MDFDWATMPEFMWDEVRKTIGVKINGRGATEGEGVAENFDFVVEDINKKLKNSLTWAPSKKNWLIACRTYNLCTTLSKMVSKWTER